MNKPHVHKDVIIAWANGAEIQFRYEGGVWRDMTINPSWDALAQYRIKPEREWPTTSLTEANIISILNFCGAFKNPYFAIADAAIKQHILDTEDK